MINLAPSLASCDSDSRGSHQPRRPTARRSEPRSPPTAVRYVSRRRTSFIVLSGLEGTYAVALTAPGLFTALLRRDPRADDGLADRPWQGQVQRVPTRPPFIGLQHSLSRSGCGTTRARSRDERRLCVSGAAVDGAAADWLPVDRSTFVVADAGFVVGEEHLADELPSAAHTRFLEHALEVLLHGVGGDAQLAGDLCRGVTSKD